MNVRPVATHLTNGVSSDLFNVPTTFGSGIYHSPLKWFYVYPKAIDQELIVSLTQNVAVGQYLTLNFPANPYTINGQPVITLDCLRVLSIYVATAQNGNYTFVINGYDEQEIAVQEQLNLGVGTQSNGDRGLKYIASIQCTAHNGPNLTQPISFGTSNVIALPEHALLSLNHVIQASWGNTFYPFAGALNNLIAPGYSWRTEPFNNEMTDARGLVTLPTDPNGTTLFTILYYVYGNDAELQAQLNIDNPEAQKIVPIGGRAPTSLISFDETGMQYPGNLTAYNVIFGG